VVGRTISQYNSLLLNAARFSRPFLTASPLPA
jgi:hypothetical protein